MNYILRAWEKRDAGTLAQCANNKKIADQLRNIFPHPYTIADAEFYLGLCVNEIEENSCTMAVAVDGAAVGSIGITLQKDVNSKCAELGYWLGEPYWGKGVMTAAVKQFCRMMFAKYDIIRIYAEVFECNRASIRVLEKAGFQLDGIMRSSIYKNEMVQNSCIYSILKDEVQAIN